MSKKKNKTRNILIFAALLVIVALVLNSAGLFAMFEGSYDTSYTDLQGNPAGNVQFFPAESGYKTIVVHWTDNQGRDFNTNLRFSRYVKESWSEFMLPNMGRVTSFSNHFKIFLQNIDYCNIRIQDVDGHTLFNKESCNENPVTVSVMLSYAYASTTGVLCDPLGAHSCTDGDEYICRADEWGNHYWDIYQAGCTYGCDANGIYCSSEPTVDCWKCSSGVLLHEQHTGTCNSGWEPAPPVPPCSGPTEITCYKCVSGNAGSKTVLGDSCPTGWAPETAPPLTDADCAECPSWKTKVDGECKLKENMCDTTNDCDDDDETCNSDHHCEDTSVTCENEWEYAHDGQCKLEEGRCNTVSDCPGRTCDTTDHKCKGIVPPTCEQFWEDPDSNCQPNWFWILIGFVVAAIVVSAILAILGKKEKPKSIFPY